MDIETVAVIVDAILGEGASEMEFAAMVDRVAAEVGVTPGA